MTAVQGLREHTGVGVQLAAVVLRGIAYAVLASFASRYDCGRALLLGLVAGELAASALALAWRWAEERGQALAEVVVLALAFAWARSERVGPVELEQRAILGLCAFGTFAARIGGTALLRLGPSEDPIG
jgi:hypothetical protein